MSITPAIWFLLFAFSLIGAFVHPVLGLFGYLLEYFQRPDLYWWGRELPDLRWSFTIGAGATMAYLLRRAALDPFRRETVVPLALMLAQAVNTSLVTTWAVSPDLSLRWSIAFWKLVVTFALFAAIPRKLRTLELVILFQIIGTAYWGWDALDARRTASRLEGIGSGDTLNSNTLAAHILTIVPLTVLFAMTKGAKWTRPIALVCAPLVMNLLILCNSRGATLGLLASGSAALLLVRRGLRTRVAMGALAGGLAVFMLADPQFFARQQTITNATDGSANSRRAIWRGGIELIKDYPLGAGGRGFHLLSPRYIAEIREDGSEGRSAHNMYIQVSADWGLQGLVLFVALVSYTFVMLHRVRRERTTPDRIYFISLGLQLGLVGTLTAAFFSSRFYGESIYWLCGMSTALYRMSSQEEKQDAPVVADEVHPAVAGLWRSASVAR